MIIFRVLLRLPVVMIMMIGGGGGEIEKRMGTGEGGSIPMTDCD